MAPTLTPRRGKCALQDLTGQRFGHWTVIRQSDWRTPSGRVMWECRCVCGNEKEVFAQGLIRGASTNCGCRRYLTNRNRLRPYEGLYNRFKADVLRLKRHSIDLTYEEFVGFTKQLECLYCGVGIFWTRYDTTTNGKAYNLDRKDNALGYTKPNLVPCCWSCNYIKGARFTHEQMVEIGLLIRKWDAHRNIARKLSAGLTGATVVS